MPTTSHPLTAWNDATAKVARLAAELRDVNARMEAETDATKKSQLAERGLNLARGLKNAELDEAATHDAALKAIAAGGAAYEPGDGAAPIRKHFSTADGGSARSILAEAILDAGFDLKRRPSVELKGYEPLAELKAQTVPAVTDWNRRAPLLSPMGQDQRYLWPYLVTDNAGMSTSIQDFQQTARTLTGTVQRTLNATSDKANVATTTTLVNTALVEFAVTLDDIPNAVLESVPQFTAFMASEGEFQVMTAIDTHVMATIVASAAPNGLTGTNLITQLRNGVSAMRALGAQPTLAVLNPTDSVTLDTYQTTDGDYLFPTRSTNTANPLWNLQIVERIGAGTEKPWLIDPQMLGVLYLGAMSFDADPYTGFKKNLTTLRVEIKGLFHIRNANGAYEIVADA